MTGDAPHYVHCRRAKRRQSPVNRRNARAPRSPPHFRAATAMEIWQLCRIVVALSLGTSTCACKTRKTTIRAMMASSFDSARNCCPRYSHIYRSQLVRFSFWQDARHLCKIIRVTRQTGHRGAQTVSRCIREGSPFHDSAFAKLCCDDGRRNRLSIARTVSRRSDLCQRRLSCTALARPRVAITATNRKPAADELNFKGGGLGYRETRSGETERCSQTTASGL